MKGEKSMWHSCLRETLLALQPANCFHAGVHSNILVCFGRNPTHFPAITFRSFNIQGELSVHKSRRLPSLLAEAIHHRLRGIYPPGSRCWQSCQVCGREEGGQCNLTPGYCWESLVCTLEKYVGGVL